MTKKYKPTSDDKRIIRECAQRSSGHKRIEMALGMRINTEKEGIEPHFNIALISDDADWNDTDLYDNSYKWSDFTKGVELTDDGRGIFDFYVYSLGYHGELETNVVAYFEDSKLVRVEGTGDGVMWSAK